MSRSDTDLVVAGVVRVRLLDAPDALVPHLARQIGGVREQRCAEPADLRHGSGSAAAHIVISFGARPPEREGRASPPAAGASVALGVVGARPGRPIPLLRSVVLLAALRHGWAPMHAAAVRVDGDVLAVAGPSGSGKTGVQLALLRRGASAVAAEWLLVRPHEIRPLPQPIRIRARHVASWPGLAPRLPPSRIGPVVAGALALGGLELAASALPGAPGGRVSSLLRGAAARVGRTMTADVEVERLAGSASGAAPALPARGLAALAILDDSPTEGSGVTELSVEGASAAMSRLLAADLADVTAHAFGWPAFDGPGGLLEDWRPRYEALLAGALGGTRRVRVGVTTGDAARDVSVPDRLGWAR